MTFNDYISQYSFQNSKADFFGLMSSRYGWSNDSLDHYYNAYLLITQDRNPGTTSIPELYQNISDADLTTVNGELKNAADSLGYNSAYTLDFLNNFVSLINSNDVPVFIYQPYSFNAGITYTPFTDTLKAAFQGTINDLSNIGKGIFSFTSTTLIILAVILFAFIILKDKILK